MFRIFIRGIGTIWVRAATAEQAREQAIKFAVNRGVGSFREFDADVNLAVPVPDNSGGFSGDGFLLEGDRFREVVNGVPIEGPLVPPGGVPRAGAPPASAVPQPTDPEFAAVINPVTEVDPPPVTPSTTGLGNLAAEGQLPQSAFNEFLRGQNVRPGSIGGNLAQTQFAPALTSFAGLNEFGLLPENTSLTSFLQRGPLGGRFAQRAQEGIGALQQRGLDADFQVTGEGGTFTDPARNLLNLARLGAGAGRSPISLGLTNVSNQQALQRLQDAAFRGENPDFLTFATGLFNRQKAFAPPVGFGGR